MAQALIAQRRDVDEPLVACRPRSALGVLAHSEIKTKSPMHSEMQAYLAAAVSGLTDSK